MRTFIKVLAHVWVSYWHVRFVQDKMIYITAQQNFLKFGNIRKFFDLSFNSLDDFCHRNVELLLVDSIDFLSIVAFLNWSKSIFAADGVVKSKKVISGNWFTACAWWDRMFRDEKYHWMSFVLSEILNRFK